MERVNAYEIRSGKLHGQGARFLPLHCTCSLYYNLVTIITQFILGKKSIFLSFFCLKNAKSDSKFIILKGCLVTFHERQYQG